MKIVIVNTVYGKGSVGRICADLYEELVRSGDEPFMATGRGHLPESVRGCTIGTFPDFAGHVLKNFFQDASGFGSERVTRRFISRLEEIAPDVIHLHNIHGFYLQTELLFDYLKRAGIPVVWTLHDCWPFTGHCAYYDHIQPWADGAPISEQTRCSRWITGCHDCPIYRTAYPYALFKDNSEKNWERKKNAYTGVPGLTIVTPSEWLAGQVKQSFLRDYPVEVLPNGIDLNVFCPASENEKPDNDDRRVVLGVANNWEERKGLKYFENLAGSLPDNYRLVIVGLNKAQIGRFSKKFKTDRVLPIARTGSVSELADLYRNADVFVNATLEDNFPTTNLEALACGTPVVTFDTGGSAESVSEHCGMVVPKGDQEALKSAIVKVCENRSFDAGSCRERAMLYDKTDFVRRYIDIYKTV